VLASSNTLVSRFGVDVSIKRSTCSPLAPRLKGSQVERKALLNFTLALCMTARRPPCVLAKPVKTSFEQSGALVLVHES
jgi:hypothetical protein